MRSIRSLGRIGGLGALIGAVVLSIFGVWMIWAVGPGRGELWSPLGVGLGLFIVLCAALLAFEGLILMSIGIEEKQPPLSKGEIRALLSRGDPLVICLDCRIVVSSAPCHQCWRSSGCMIADEEEGRRLLRAALSLEDP